jgi:hypothetical protein
MEHLSEPWIRAFDEVVRHHEGLRAATADRRVVVQYVVEPGAPHRDQPRAAYAVVLDHGDNRVVVGDVDDPDITLTTDRATAVAVATHQESAQTAFMGGRLRLGGDVRVLIADQAVLAGIDDCTAELRRATDFGPGAEPTVEVGGA